LWLIAGLVSRGYGFRKIKKLLQCVYDLLGSLYGSVGSGDSGQRDLQAGVPGVLPCFGCVDDLLLNCDSFFEAGAVSLGFFPSDCREAGAD
jgi:hypothetical protein